jgi:magnesium chelatase family protein
VEPSPPEVILGPAGESSASVRERVSAAIERQARRYAGEGRVAVARAGGLNARLDPTSVERFCRLDAGAARAFQFAVQRLALSSRACHSILKVARTIADLAGSENLGEEMVLEAVQHRRFGDGDEIWPGD